MSNSGEFRRAASASPASSMARIQANRWSSVSLDPVASVLYRPCHEPGHTHQHGGAPFTSPRSWMSVSRPGSHSIHTSTRRSRFPRRLPERTTTSREGASSAANWSSVSVLCCVAAHSGGLIRCLHEHCEVGYLGCRRSSRVRRVRRNWSFRCSRHCPAGRHLDRRGRGPTVWPPIPIMHPA